MSPKYLIKCHKRFMARVNKTDDGCWIWTVKPDKNGYCRFTIKSKTYLAHRVGYQLFAGEIPEGLVIDHLCRVRNCVNPEHLEPVTIRENSIRGLVPKLIRARNESIVACPKGHQYTPENTYIDPRKKRNCRTCSRASKKRYETRKRQEKLAII